MPVAYTPGLKVSASMPLRARRTLPLDGEVLVQVGDEVKANDVVARTFMPGAVYPLNLANQLAISAGDVSRAMLKQPGETIEVGEIIARTEGIFGFFKSEFKAKTAGTIETVSPVTGQVIVRGEPRPIEVQAFLTGTVAEVIDGLGVVVEAEVAYVQGIFGIGGESYGTLVKACDQPSDDLTADRITEEMAGTVVIGGARMTGEAVRKAMDLGVSAVISGGMDDQDLKEILGYDLGVAVTGSEPIPTTIIITEGFGDIAMAGRTFELLTAHQGEAAAVNGATQIRAGVMRPEIVIPTGQQTGGTAESVHVAGELAPGAPVRIIRDPYFGRQGVVESLPSEPTVLDSGSKARVLTVKVNDGEVVTVPRANVELLG